MKQLLRSHGVVILCLVLCLVSVIAIAISIYMYGQYRSTQDLIKKTANGSPEEVQTLVRAIGTVMELPTGETPTLATVTDITKLPNIPFFAHAAAGDKVLIYQQAAKALLYRPSTKKIIDTSAFNTQGTTDLTTSSIKKESGTVELRNGTTKNGLTAAFEKKLIQYFPEMRVVSKSMAKRSTYTDSMVIAKNNSFTSRATEISKALDISLGTLPPSEASISADILIILGADTVVL